MFSCSSLALWPLDLLHGRVGIIKLVLAAVARGYFRSGLCIMHSPGVESLEVSQSQKCAAQQPGYFICVRLLNTLVCCEICLHVGGLKMCLFRLNRNLNC